MRQAFWMFLGSRMRSGRGCNCWPNGYGITECLYYRVMFHCVKMCLSTLRWNRANPRVAFDAATTLCFHAELMRRSPSERVRSPTMRTERAKLKPRRDATTIAQGNPATAGAALGGGSKIISSFFLLLTLLFAGCAAPNVKYADLQPATTATVAGDTVTVRLGSDLSRNHAVEAGF